MPTRGGERPAVEWGDTISGPLRNFYIHANVCGTCYVRPFHLCATGSRILDEHLPVGMVYAEFGA